MLSTGKSRVKSALVVPRLKLAVPSVFDEPNGLSGVDSALDLWVSSSRRRPVTGFHTALKPSDLFWVRVAKSAPPMAMSLDGGTISPFGLRVGRMNSVYICGAAMPPTGLDQALVESPKLNQADMSWRRVWILFSE